jgi:hypothetical protein
MDVLIEPPVGSGPGEDDDAYAPPPADPSWRARTTGPAWWFATMGVVLGLVMLVVPGVLALRDRTEWLAGRRYRPRFAWGTAAVGIWALAVVPLVLFTSFGGFAVFAGVVVLPIWVRAAARQ